MNPIALKFKAWTERETLANSLIQFRVAFAAIWLVYDGLDFLLGGTKAYLWLYPNLRVLTLLSVFQITLIVCELGLLLGFRPKVFAGIAILARVGEIYLFPLNDFFFFIVVLGILLFCDCDSRSLGKKIPAWPMDVLVGQLAWIYLATALLKLGPSFVSGGDLYVRQNYLAAFLNWPFPAWYRAFISTLFGNSLLAYAAVSLELALSVTLFAWVFSRRHRRTLRPIAICLVVAIHSFAAATTNVFFFGADMIAAVFLLTRS